VAVRHSNHFGTCMYYTRRKIYLARNQQVPIPLGWAINQAGEPTTDPQKAIDGIILPMAEHKGYAIAAMVDMLSGVLTGSGFLSAVHSPYHTAEHSYCGHLMLAMDIAKFQPLEQFTARMQAFADEIKAVPLAKGFDEVFYPGEIEDRNNTKFRREGLALPQETIADLRRIAQDIGLETPLPDLDGDGEAV
jgi:LDH2 family malate/lactate/ureidoglycolate dehydrogenase